MPQPRVAIDNIAPSFALFKNYLVKSNYINVLPRAHATRNEKVYLTSSVP
jgi:hypothetical protein